MTTLTVPFDSNGHLLTRKPISEVNVLAIEFPGEEPHLYLDRARMSYSCGMCGSFIDPEVTKEAVRVKDACPASGGITSVIRLEVPSGKIVVDDDMRPMFNGFDHDGFADYNSALGQHQVIEAFAEDKCAFGPVGNSCPALWQIDEGEYIIGRKPWVESLDDPWMDEDDVLAPEGARKLASVCTDLWAYSIVDFDEWVRRGGDPEDLPGMAEVVEIPAGTYEFTHHTNELDFDHDADDVVYADIKKIK